jgi:hypothetical protein
VNGEVCNRRTKDARCLRLWVAVIKGTDEDPFLYISSSLCLSSRRREGVVRLEGDWIDSTYATLNSKSPATQTLLEVHCTVACLGEEVPTLELTSMTLRRSGQDVDCFVDVTGRFVVLSRLCWERRLSSEARRSGTCSARGNITPTWSLLPSTNDTLTILHVHSAILSGHAADRRRPRFAQLLMVARLAQFRQRNGVNGGEKCHWR